MADARSIARSRKNCRALRNVYAFRRIAQPATHARIPQHDALAAIHPTFPVPRSPPSEREKMNTDRAIGCWPGKTRQRLAGAFPLPAPENSRTRVQAIRASAFEPGDI